MLVSREKVIILAGSAVAVYGNITRDLELRNTPSGRAMLTFGLAVNDFWTNAQGERQENTSFYDVVVWRDLAENVSSSLKKGDRVLVIGRLEQNSWTDEQDVRHSRVRIVADEVGASLRFATCEVKKRPRPDSA